MGTLANALERMVNRLARSCGTGSGQAAHKSHLEVERKFRISEDEWRRLPETLRARGFEPDGQVIMTDTFLPTSNDGDMMRVRNETEAGKRRTLLTLKSWVRTADGGKERQETERSIGRFLAAVLVTVGRWLNGSHLLSFSKHRQMFATNISGQAVVVSIDRVSGLGEYSGCYLEVEILVPVGQDVTLAREHIYALVSELFGEARQPVELSYMEMLKRSARARN